MKRLLMMFVMLVSLFTSYCFAAAPPAPTERSTPWNDITEKGRFIAKDVVASRGLLSVHETFIDIAAVSTFSYINKLVPITTLTASGTSYTLAKTDYANSVHGRNITVSIFFVTGTSTMTVNGSLVVVGVDMRGNSATETLSISTTAATGNTAWASITSLTIGATSISSSGETDARINIGRGTKIGLSNNVYVAGDIRKVIGAAVLDTTYTLSTTIDTIIFTAAPNNTNDYEVTYNAISR